MSTPEISLKALPRLPYGEPVECLPPQLTQLTPNIASRLGASFLPAQLYVSFWGRSIFICLVNYLQHGAYAQRCGMASGDSHWHRISDLGSVIRFCRILAQQ